MSDLKDQSFGSLAGVCVLALGAVWIIETPPLLRLCVSTVVLTILLSFPILKILYAKRLEKKRSSQLDALRKQAEK
ncbi:MAG: hypothetical protein R3261_13615 [Alphaproteobacteria bacterium]|nr:hypothetical protein [Alphaproteobacteria bacterium]